jgi:glyoxylase-like metal-dependent hydrolase (beta-lactamase superfamily II)
MQTQLQYAFGAKPQKLHVAMYQFPVSLGDCSVHLLVNDKGEVESSFLMDGSTGTNAGRVIFDGLCILKAAYGAGWKKPLGLWVVTHWDADHYMGMLNFLKNYNHKSPKLFDGKLMLYAG